MQQRNEAIQELDGEIEKLQSGINELSHELEAKGKEILKIRSESNMALR